MPIPTATPIIRLPKNTSKKVPMASKKLMMLKDPPLALPGLYLCAVSNNTIAIASLSIDSPNMTVYSFGSTLYALNMASIVTGSVAERVAPIENASTKEMSKPSRGIRVQRYSNTPRTTAEMKVPAKAKVRIVPIFRKKFAWIDRSVKGYKIGAKG